MFLFISTIFPSFIATYKFVHGLPVPSTTFPFLFTISYIFLHLLFLEFKHQFILLRQSSLFLLVSLEVTHIHLKLNERVSHFHQIFLLITLKPHLTLWLADRSCLHYL